MLRGKSLSEHRPSRRRGRGTIYRLSRVYRTEVHWCHAFGDNSYVIIVLSALDRTWPAHHAHCSPVCARSAVGVNRHVVPVPYRLPCSRVRRDMTVALTSVRHMAPLLFNPAWICRILPSQVILPCT